MHTATDTHLIITIARDEFKTKAIVMMMIDDSTFGPAETILIKCCSSTILQVRSNTSSDPTRGRRRFKEVLLCLLYYQFFVVEWYTIPAAAIFDEADVMKDCLGQKSNAVTASNLTGDSKNYSYHVLLQESWCR